MPRWLYFAPVIALVAASAVLGLSLGRKAANPSEAAVIARIATHYVAEAAGAAQISDCTARAANSEALWLVITCIPPGGGENEKFEYFIDRFGALEHRNAP